MDDVLRQRKREATAHRQALRLAHSDITEQAALFSQLTVPEVLGNRKLLQELTGKSTEWWALPLEPNPVLMPTVTAVSAVGETQDTVEALAEGWERRHVGFLAAAPKPSVKSLKYSPCRYGWCFCAKGEPFARTVLAKFNAAVKSLGNDALLSGNIMIQWTGFLVDDRFPKGSSRTMGGCASNLKHRPRPWFSSLF